MKTLEGFGQSVGSAVGGAAVGLGAISETAGDHIVTKFKYAHGDEATEVLKEFGRGSGHLGQAAGTAGNLVNPIALGVQTGVSLASGAASGAIASPKGGKGMASLKSLRDLDALTQPSSVLGGPTTTTASASVASAGKSNEPAPAPRPRSSRMSSTSDLDSLGGNSRGNPAPKEDLDKIPWWKFSQSRAQESKV